MSKMSMRIPKTPKMRASLKGTLESEKQHENRTHPHHAHYNVH